MTDKNYTHIVTIIDRSGSMSNLVDDTIGGFNTFLQKQKEADGKATITRVQFDDKYQIDYDMIDVRDASLLDHSSYVPRGMTSLLDAVGRTVTSVGETISKIDEDSRPGKVIILIITDGLENSSREYKATKVKEIVNEQIEKYSWEFVYMGGGDIESQKEQGESLGVKSRNVYNYSLNNTDIMYASISDGVLRCRSNVQLISEDSFLSNDEIDNIK